MKENETSSDLALIVDALRRIQQEGGSGNFCIFVADPQANYYIQFAGQAGDPNLYAEAAGNEVINPPFKLNAVQLRRLESLGWSAPHTTPNFHRQWQAADDKERERIAQIVLATFAEVYAIPSGHPLDVTVVLE